MKIQLDDAQWILGHLDKYQFIDYKIWENRNVASPIDLITHDIKRMDSILSKTHDFYKGVWEFGEYSIDSKGKVLIPFGNNVIEDIVLGMCDKFVECSFQKIDNENVFAITPPKNVKKEDFDITVDGLNFILGWQIKKSDNNKIYIDNHLVINDFIDKRDEYKKRVVKGFAPEVVQKIDKSSEKSNVEEAKMHLIEAKNEMRYYELFEVIKNGFVTEFDSHGKLMPPLKLKQDLTGDQIQLALFAKTLVLDEFATLNPEMKRREKLTAAYANYEKKCNSEKGFMDFAKNVKSSLKSGLLNNDAFKKSTNARMQYLRNLLGNKNK